MLIDMPSLESTIARADDPPELLAAELAWCLRRFVTARADELAMRRAVQALAAWEAWSQGITVEPSG